MSNNTELVEIKKYLHEYSGPDIRIMEICGSHTGAIAKNGIPGMLSEKIHLISGPGCPVCVTPSSYVDRLIELSLEPDTTVLTFGDLLRVPGSRESLREAEGRGASVKMVYSPMDTVAIAKEAPDKKYVFAAIGFETTTPVYALLLDTLIKENIKNVKLLTALKTMPEIVDTLCSSGAQIDAFLAPGHVCVVTGSRVFEKAAEKYSLPFVVSGFDGPGLLASIAMLVKHRGEGVVINNYQSVVDHDGNVKAQELIDKYFCKSDAVWRGIGSVPDSGYLIRESYAAFDAGSAGLSEDEKRNKACSCDKVIMGLMPPEKCPLFGKICTPENPQGACMVSPEGSCNTAYSY
jgi:hydrogenase expression/formation protein HypD